MQWIALDTYVHLTLGLSHRKYIDQAEQQQINIQDIKIMNINIIKDKKTLSYRNVENKDIELDITNINFSSLKENEKWIYDFKDGDIRIE